MTMRLYDINYDAGQQKVSAVLCHPRYGSQWKVGMSWTGLEMDQWLFRKLNAVDLFNIALQLRLLFEAGIGRETVVSSVWIEKQLGAQLGGFVA